MDLRVAEPTPRPATDADAERIAALHIASWHHTYARELSRGFRDAQTLEDRTALWRDRIAGGTTVLVAESGGALDGFVSCGPAHGSAAGPGVWEIYNLHAAPHRIGHGIGSRLFDAAARLGRDQGFRALVLWVVETNDRARAFYERKGMRPDGAEQDHSLGAESLHEVRYRMPL